MVKEITPDEWTWQISIDDIEQIKQNNRNTINNVYFNNLERFTRMAKKYCKATHNLDIFEDCISQIYVDLTEYDYSKSLKLYWSIIRTFRNVCYSLRLSQFSIDESVDENSDTTFHNFFYKEQEDTDELREQEEKVFKMIAQQTQLTNLQKDQLIAYALNIRVYKGVYNELTKAITK